MLQIKHNVISAEEIALFRSYYNTFSDQKYINAESTDHLFSDQGPVIDHRLLIEEKNSKQCWNIVKRVTQDFLPGCKNIWANYQRQRLPHNLHVDDYCKHFDVPTYTIIIALDDCPEFNVVIFNEEAKSNDDLKEKKYAWATPAPKMSLKKSNVSQTADVEHTIDPVHRQYYVDWLTHEGTVSYTAGTGTFFLASQIHCSGNWKKYNKFEYKDLVQIHAHYDKGEENVAI